MVKFREKWIRLLSKVEFDHQLESRIMLCAVEGVGVLLDGDAALAAEAGPTHASRGGPAFLPRQAFHLAAPYFPPAGTAGVEGACSENAAKKRRKREHVRVP